MKAGQFSTDLQEFLRLLAAHEVRYVIIGGIAVIYHGYGRLTGDSTSSTTALPTMPFDCGQPCASSGAARCQP